MTPDELAAIHAACFIDTPRPWTASEFASMLAPPQAFLVGSGDGFAVGRTVGDETELLTLAVKPEARGRGLGRGLLLAFEATAAAGGARDVVLEVAENNLVARALYESLGYARAGRRPGYYRPHAAPAVSAIIMRKRLAPAGAPDAGKTN